MVREAFRQKAICWRPPEPERTDATENKPGAAGSEKLQHCGWSSGFVLVFVLKVLKGGSQTLSMDALNPSSPSLPPPGRLMPTPEVRFDWSRNPQAVHGKCKFPRGELAWRAGLASWPGEPDGLHRVEAYKRKPHSPAKPTHGTTENRRNRKKGKKDATHAMPRRQSHLALQPASTRGVGGDCSVDGEACLPASAYV